MEFGSRTSIFEKPFINDHVKDDAADDKDSEDGEDDEDDEDDEDGLITPGTFTLHAKVHVTRNLPLPQWWWLWW